MSFIGLLDCNNFFVSCERLFRPDLINKPVVVLSGNDGCIVARSNEVKSIGIPMGVPYFQVKTELEAVGVTAFSSNFKLYHDLSKRVMSVLESEVGSIERYSIDESFFRIDEPLSDIENWLFGIKNIVEAQTGIPVTTGAGKTKTIAKQASKIGKKKNGVTLLHSQLWKEETKNTDLSSVWGIGPKLSQKMSTYELKTVADLLAVDRSKVADIFGLAGVRKYDELSEVVVDQFGEEDSLPQSIMSTHTLHKGTSDLSVLKNEIAHHVSQVAAELRLNKQKAGVFYIMMRPSRHSDWQLRGGSSDVRLSEPTHDTRVLLNRAKIAIDQLYEEEVPYKKVGVVASRLVHEDYVQTNLFQTETTAGNNPMMVIDQINRKFGGDYIALGKEIAGVTNKGKSYLSPAYTTNWQQIKKVKA